MAENQVGDWDPLAPKNLGPQNIDFSKIKTRYDLKPSIDYIWDEPKTLKELQDYIDKTYGQHYAGSQVIQTTEYIASNLTEPGEAIGAFKFNVIKYAARYGKKGGRNKADLMKAMHYLVMLMALHNRMDNAEASSKDS